MFVTERRKAFVFKTKAGQYWHCILRDPSISCPLPFSVFKIIISPFHYFSCLFMSSLFLLIRSPFYFTPKMALVWALHLWHRYFRPPQRLLCNFMKNCCNLHCNHFILSRCLCYISFSCSTNDFIIFFKFLLKADGSNNVWFTKILSFSLYFFLLHSCQDLLEHYSSDVRSFSVDSVKLSIPTCLLVLITCILHGSISILNIHFWAMWLIHSPL